MRCICGRLLTRARFREHDAKTKSAKRNTQQNARTSARTRTARDSRDTVCCHVKYDYSFQKQQSDKSSQLVRVCDNTRRDNHTRELSRFASVSRRVCVCDALVFFVCVWRRLSCSLCCSRTTVSAAVATAAAATVDRPETPALVNTVFADPENFSVKHPLAQK